MRLKSQIRWCTRKIFLLGVVFFSTLAFAQSNVNVRVMAANLNGDSQKYEPFALRIFQGLKPDVVCIQEFNYTSTNGLEANTPAAFREMLDSAFGTNFVYFREPYTDGGDIPNGVISRYPILNSGSWTDTQVANRGFAWAQIDLPGTNDLYVVSVHLLTSSAAARGTEAANLKTLIRANFPSNAWIVVAGDFNTGSRTETPTMTTFDSYLSDNPIPVDDLGNSDTSMNRNHPHDYVLPSFSLTNLETTTAFPAHTYPKGLVFDSRVYSDLSDFYPVQSADSGLAQHMAVMKDFLISTNGASVTNPPTITSQPQSQTVIQGSNATFTVTVSSILPVTYQWLFKGTNILSSTTNSYTVINAQSFDAGSYSVAVSNSLGGLISSNATLTVVTSPVITTNPASQTVNRGDTVTFTVTAVGAPPLTYQWRFNATNLPGSTTNSYMFVNAQTTNAGNYSVIVTNNGGAVNSAPAVLTVIVPGQTSVIAQWNFNSTTPDGSTTTGTTTPSTGVGTASLVGGTTATFATGDTTLDPAGSTDNSGWNTTGYPAQGTGNKTRGVQFTVSTAGRQNIVISWSSQSSNTGSKYGRLQYTTNGIDFVDFQNAFINGVSFTVKTNSLAAISGVNNNTNFAFRFVSEFENTAANTANTNYVPANSSSYGTAGTMRYDMVTVSGSSYIVATAAALTSIALTNDQFAFTLSGSVGASYVVQISTNLAATNWISVFTNVSPYIFTDINLTAPQKFYRAFVQP